MTTVRMLRRITGLRDGVEWPEIGNELELPEWEAIGLQISGMVEIVETRPASASVEPPLGAVGPAGVATAAPAGSARRRKS